jgi:uncharacterized membrane protein YkvI
MLQIPTKMLLLVAAAVWLIAGACVVSVGVTAGNAAWSLNTTIALLIVFLLFLIMFLMISRKHIKRVLGYTDKLSSITKFFDANSYAIMAVMILLGVTVRISGLVPDNIIAPFYTGLGLALLVSALYYLVTYIAVCDELAAKN